MQYAARSLAARSERRPAAESVGRRPAAAAYVDQRPAAVAQRKLMQMMREAEPQAPAPVSAPQQMVSVGSADDPAEREADTVAREVVTALRSSEGADDGGGHPGAAAVSAPSIRRAPDGDGGTAVVGREGGAIGGELAQSVLQPSGGSPLDAALKPRLEGAFGASFDNVRIHRDSQTAPQIGARAFTHGSDIHFAPGEYQPHSDDGLRMLGHELTHVVQQSGGAAVPGSPASRIARATGPVRRDIGFEFETKNLYTRRTNGGALPAGGFPDRATGDAAWTDPNATRLAKGQALLAQPDIEVQADDNGQNSDLEVVTTHFPETGPGRARLNTAMGNLTNVVNAHAGLVAAGGGYVPAAALVGNGFNLQMPDGLILGNWAAATTAGQVTMGVRLQNIPNIVRDLHGAPGEAGGDKATRDPGRLRLRRPNPANAAEPVAPHALSEAATLIRGAGLAAGAIANYHALDNAAPGGPELEGLLTIVFSYAESMQHKAAFLKNHTPLMAKTNLATMWTTLPGPVQTYYGRTNKWGTTNFEKLVSTSPGYAARMSQPLFQGVGGLLEDNKAAGQKQWYHQLTMKSWLRGIALRDTSTGAAIKQFFFGPSGSTKRRGVDQLTSAAFPKKPANQEVEGYGALGANMDVHPGTNAPLPVFELRSASRPITYAAAQQWALDMFDYVVSLNANPGGGYQHIV
jgi:hypothetical protein